MQRRSIREQKEEAWRQKAPKDERLDRHHTNSSSDFWEDQELQGTRITLKIKGPKRYHSREDRDYYEDSLDKNHHANGSSSFQEDQKLQKTGITRRNEKWTRNLEEGTQTGDQTRTRK